MRVLIRADGNKAIGMGHIAREAELALALGSCGFEVAFLTRSQEPALKKLNERGLNAVTIDERMNRTQEENAVLEEVKKYKPDLLVLDVFVQYEKQFLLALKKHARITCCVLDQPEQMDIACDVVVNGNPVQMQYLYPNHYLVGPTYFMMAPLFLNLHKCLPAAFVNPCLTVSLCLLLDKAVYESKYHNCLLMKSSCLKILLLQNEDSQ